MGTRGAWGFRFKGVDKLTYNHFDSYPSWLGLKVLDAVRANDDERLAGTANRLVLLSNDDKPTEADKERYRDVANLGVSESSLDDWYCLLREGQGEPARYIDGTYDHCYNGNDFLAESLFCEWAYVINVDERVVEVYKGFNNVPGGAGRYAELRDRRGEYYGVTLLTTVSFDDLRKLSDVKELANSIEKMAYPEEEG